MRAIALSVVCHALLALLLAHFAAKQRPSQPAETIAVGLQSPAEGKEPLPPAPQAQEIRAGTAGQQVADASAASPERMAAVGGAAGTADSLYIRGVHGRVAALKRYPPTARSLGHEGIVTLSFSIYRDGRAGDIVVTHSSGHSSLDQSAVELVRSASPFLPLPPELSPGPLTLTLPIAFELAR